MSIEINLNNPGMITKGATLRGTVICRFELDENIRGILCSLRGKECTKWTQGSGKNSTTYTGKNKFLMQDINFVGNGKISRGVYEYPFVFQFPDIPLPSSYIHFLGSVQYYIKAKVDRPMAFDYEESITLHVATPVDLNDEVNLQQLRNSTYQFEKFPTICCCTSEPVNVDLVLNKSAFIVGELIEGKLNIENMSDLRISKIKISLISHIKFMTEKPAKRVREEDNLIAERREEGLSSNSEKLYNFNLQIPQMAIHNFTQCRLITHRWILRVHIIFPSLHRNIKCDADIKLGHVPVGANSVTDIPGLVTNITINSASQSAMGQPETMPSAPLSEEDRIPLIDEDHPSAPPPSYADVTKDE